LHPDQSETDPLHRWPRWLRNPQVRLLGLCAAVILITWLTLALLAYFWNLDRVIGAQLP
jgi:hypothetical protein